MGNTSDYPRQMIALTEGGQAFLKSWRHSFARSLGRSFVGSVALMGAAAAMNVLPAFAGMLQEWGYDAQTQVLTLTLPDSVLPTVSTVAPDQLVLELPNTQVGDVMGQNVGDGLVESIVVEQATPETVWIVMEFAEGTVLATAQNAVPLAETATGDQQWQLRPAFVAASRRAAESTVVASAPPVVSEPSTVGASANDLRAPELTTQAPDFSDLPILEPAVIVDEPVSVPSLPSAPVAVEPVEPEQAPEVVAESAPVAVPEIEAVPDVVVAEESVTEEESVAEGDAIALEVIPAETIPNNPVARVPEPTVSVPEVPEEPPFIGVDEELEALPIEALPTVESNSTLPAVESDMEDEDAIAIPAIPAEPAEAIAAPIEPVFVEPTPVEPAPVEQIARESTDSEFRLTDEQVRAAQFDNELEESATAVEALPFEQVTPASGSRWPEPIPFGQPLPR